MPATVFEPRVVAQGTTGTSTPLVWAGERLADTYPATRPATRAFGCDRLTGYFLFQSFLAVLSKVGTSLHNRA